MSVIVRNSQVVPLSHLYISGCDVSIASTTVLAISPGQARDASNMLDMPVGFQNVNGDNVPPVLFQDYRQPLFVNSAVVGANGIDQGALAASSQYAVYLIGDSSQNNPVAGLMSLASNANPVLPAGYDAVRLLGFCATDGSVHFVYATSKPQLMSRALAYYLSPAVSVLSGGSATSFTAVDCDAAANTDGLENVILELLVTYVPALAGNTAQFRPTGSSATAGLATITGAAAGVAQTQYLQIISGVGSTKCEFDYKVIASDSLTVLVVGFIAAPHVVYPT